MTTDPHPPAQDHASDCAVHNGPAYEPGPCDCGALQAQDTPDHVSGHPKGAQDGPANSAPPPTQDHQPVDVEVIANAIFRCAFHPEDTSTDARLAECKVRFDAAWDHAQEDAVEDISELAPPNSEALASMEEIANLRGEVERLVSAIGEHVTVRGEYFAQLQAANQEVERLRAILTECADELEAEISARASGELPRHIKRDMDTVVRARVALAPVGGEG